MDTVRGEAGRDAEEGRVEGALAHLLDHPLAGTRPQADPHVRMAQAVLPQHRREVDGRDGRDRAEGQRAAYLSGGRRHLRTGPPGRLQGLPGGGQERLARGGQPHPAAGPVEQPGAQFPLQPGHLVAERGLRHVAPLGGPGEAPGLRDREDVAHLLEVHASDRGSRWKG